MAKKNVTKKGKGFTSSDSSLGATEGVGSTYSAVLNEWPNKSNTRNMGPERAPSPSVSSPLPVVMEDSRVTGKVG